MKGRHSDLQALVAKEVEISKDGEIYRGMLMGQVKDYCDDEPKDNRWIIYILDEEGTYVSEIRFALNDGWKVSLDDFRDVSPRGPESHGGAEKGQFPTPWNAEWPPSDSFFMTMSASAQGGAQCAGSLSSAPLARSGPTGAASLARRGACTAEVRGSNPLSSTRKSRANRPGFPAPTIPRLFSALARKLMVCGVYSAGTTGLGRRTRK